MGGYWTPYGSRWRPCGSCSTTGGTPRARRPGPGDGVIEVAQPVDTGTETREQWLGRAIEMMRPEFADAGAPLPEDLAVSCSWPSGNPRTVIGECWVAEASSRGYVEVFISPVLDQVAGIQGVLVTLRHELVHAAGRRGHGKAFKALAVELGLTGPRRPSPAPNCLTSSTGRCCPSWASTRTAQSPGGARSWSPPPSQATSRSSCGRTTGQRSSPREC
jgi:hypothetical protein